MQIVNILRHHGHIMGGIQLLCMGILGQYLAKTYLETKHRPIYILAETDKENPDGTKTD